jgi:hypothetical protein
MFADARRQRIGIAERCLTDTTVVLSRLLAALGFVSLRKVDLLNALIVSKRGRCILMSYIRPKPCVAGLLWLTGSRKL